MPDSSYIGRPLNGILIGKPALEPSASEPVLLNRPPGPVRHGRTPKGVRPLCGPLEGTPVTLRKHEATMSPLRRISVFVLVALLQSLALAGPIQDANVALDRRDYEAAVAILKPLAEAGDVDALGTMGNIYGFGWGVERDLKVAHDYWQRAARKHLSTAMFNLGALYLAGKPGFEQDAEKAAEWMRLAAEHRHIQAMLNLSSMYATGRGMKQDLESALAWSSLALSNANDPALKAAASGQLQRLAKMVPRERFPDIQVQIGSLAKTIDANVKAYTSQSAP